MTDNSDPRRDALHAFLQQQGAPGHDTELDGALLTGWAVVLEWVDTDGTKWLSRGYASTTSLWNAKGMWHESLYGTWSDEDDEEDDTDEGDDDG